MPATVPQEKPRKRLPELNSLGGDFALLGLRTREARTDAIRLAAKRVAHRIRAANAGPAAEKVMLSELATSTYRLLDPRRRKKAAERVRLCVFSELDLELQSRAAISWFTENPPPKVTSRSVELSKRLRSKVSRAGTLGASLIAWLLAGSLLSSLAFVLTR